jgi:hypothetical protein
LLTISGKIDPARNAQKFTQAFVSIPRGGCNQQAAPNPKSSGGFGQYRAR